LEVLDSRNGNEKEENNMPLIEVKTIENVFTPDEKKQLITRLTDAMVAIKGESVRPVTWVTIEDVRSGEWGIGGQAMTTADVRTLLAGQRNGGRT